MQSDPAPQDEELKKLIQERDKILQKKAALLAERDALLRSQQKTPFKQETMNGAKSESTKNAPISKDVFGRNVDSSVQSSNSGRRNFLSNLALGVTLTFSSLGLLLWLSAPSVERAAYLQLTVLFEEGSAYLRNKIGKVYRR